MSMMVRFISMVGCGFFSVVGFMSAALADTPDPISPETVIRTLVHSTGSGVAQLLVSNPATATMPDLSGEWDILEVEDNRRYKATLDKNGNGPYTHQGGSFVTTNFADRLWQGTWHQPGNDREGGFEVLLSEDGTQAKGIWWYNRVGNHKNIPPREHGGTYEWKRLSPPVISQ